ncbi:UDP-N-acetylmuramate:L-alanyl-gamma-D-glutamyl-meso-diaminopimelate ligase [Luminiphilus syltensis NOR5-1B]|uniref:UDP-N-acetylmuramate--L-alanyl-gamma-D-glutamyl-meso-2,6-diaminoheptandioate ligase n=2 Tax=Luminiphilus TaxID=1341118 RepID=B8KRX6_9GAMM|nr:UDP-N-acetylmuramate:L-alanyl-gamma-D-glutamyl-meso-diaminopimelate ligase [Luminiphilus syltensis NOR5-1B]
MGGLALLAREMGYRVSGSDAQVYPPMSTQLRESGITVEEGYHPEHLQPAPDLVVVGNAMSRGNPAIEYMLNANLPYTSGPQWLGEHLLADRWVLAVSGTHGKTTTTSLLAWILEYAGMDPGFLVGGVPANFGVSARLGGSDFFVVEADEYDTAFFDKRSKFIHYKPRTLIIGNLEYDHADIFPDLAAIEQQFHHLIRCVPEQGHIIHDGSAAVQRVLERGCWTPAATVGQQPDCNWSWQVIAGGGGEFVLKAPDGQSHSVTWPLFGAHNVANASAAMAAARHVGIAPRIAAKALADFNGVKRRLEWRGSPGGVSVYDDFAHHPTAIATTLAGMKARMEGGRLIAVIEPRSNTMRAGVHAEALGPATEAADRVFWFEPPGLNWALERIVSEDPDRSSRIADIDALVGVVVDTVRPGDTVVVMSNGGFSGFHDRLLEALQNRAL